jgi:hypothetical protein
VQDDKKENRAVQARAGAGCATGWDFERDGRAGVRGLREHAWPMDAAVQDLVVEGCARGTLLETEQQPEIAGVVSWLRPRWSEPF